MSAATPALKLKPHHLVDIFTALGEGKTEYQAHEYGHALHTVAANVLDNPKIEIELILGADDICAPCRNNLNGACVDTIDTSFRPQAPHSKQEWNLRLDTRWLARLGLKAGAQMTADEFCRRVLRKIGDLPAIYAEEPAQRIQTRRRKLLRGIAQYLQHARAKKQSGRLPE